jgi:hypothetical protein
VPLKTCFKIVRVTQDAGNQQKSLAEADRYPNFMTTGHHGIVQAPQLPKSNKIHGDSTGCQTGSLRKQEGEDSTSMGNQVTKKNIQAHHPSKYTL